MTYGADQLDPDDAFGRLVFEAASRGTGSAVRGALRENVAQAMGHGVDDEDCTCSTDAVRLAEPRPCPVHLVDDGLLGALTSKVGGGGGLPLNASADQFARAMGLGNAGTVDHTEPFDAA